MNVKKIAFDNVSAFSNRDTTYQLKPHVFQDFYAYAPDEEGLKLAIKDRSKYPVNRQVLHDEIMRQYAGTELTPIQEKNIAALKNENTFTAITAHQPALFGGPMYYIYKIISVINLAEQLTANTSSNIVPVFINGSEDHDFEEVNHFNLFGKSMAWDNYQGGPVGRYKVDGLKDIIDTITPILGSGPHAQKMIAFLNDALAAAKDYNGFVFHFVNELFKDWGLVVVNMDNPVFKSLFVPIMQAELLHQPSAEIIRNTQQKISELGYSEQAFARDINLFYMKDGLRERIVKENNTYTVNNTSITFTEEAIIDELNKHPEHFSPNVVMRPMYEEAVMPNIAYIGGGGELAYWLERKSQFEHFNVFFPCLIRRDSVLMVSKAQAHTLAKLDIDIEDMFLHEDRLTDIYLNKNVAIDLTSDEEIKLIVSAFDLLKTKAYNADKTLGAFVDGEKNKTLKVIEQIEARIKRSLKKNEETSINQLKSLKQKLFPNNGLQERTDNFMQYYNTMGDQLFEVLKKELNPLDKSFKIIIEE
jgi:bacillithiol synthase